MLLKRKLALCRKYLPYYIFLIIPVAQVVVFNYFPMYGIQIAFKKFVVKRGITGSDWRGLYWFEKMFTDPTFYRVLGNTLRLSLESLVIVFPATIVFALLMNEVGNQRFKRISQTITYLPHFLSWVIVGGFVRQLLSPTYGVVNAVMMKLGMIDQPIYFLIQSSKFDGIYILASMWKELGWGIVIYLAAISGISASLYESASLDGANRFQKVIFITLPSLLPTISTMFILRLGSVLGVGFDPIFNLYTEGTYDVADVISTYVYRRGLVEAKYEYTTAINLFQNVVGFLLLFGGNYVIKKFDSSYRII